MENQLAESGSDASKKRLLPHPWFNIDTAWNIVNNMHNKKKLLLAPVYLDICKCTLANVKHEKSWIEKYSPEEIVELKEIEEALIEVIPKLNEAVKEHNEVYKYILNPKLYYPEDPPLTRIEAWISMFCHCLWHNFSKL